MNIINLCKTFDAYPYLWITEQQLTTYSYEGASADRVLHMRAKHPS